ncbi:hypothetical protein CGQ24_08185 [Arthrobacter sp. 7749]|nr:hypothetical protein CGQ24_08185 [Arthrobacter sp. 7749]
MQGTRVWSVSTANWTDKVLISPTDCPWSRAPNAGASHSANFNVYDEATAKHLDAGLFDPLDRVIVVEDGGVVTYAGFLWDDVYDDDAGTLEVTHDDIWSILELRLIAEDRTASIRTWKKTYSGLSYDTIAKRIMQLATSGIGRNIPIRYEDDYTGGETRTYNGYNLDTALDALTEIMDLDDGPDIDFRPEWAEDGSLRWTMRTGDLSPEGQTIEVNLAAPKTELKGIKYQRSARNMATLQVGIGEGSGVDMLVRTASRSGAFTLDVIDEFKNIKDNIQLQKNTTSALAARKLISQIDFSIRADSPRFGNMWDLKPGTLVRWFSRGKPRIPDGWHTSEIIRYSGNVTSDWIDLELQDE